MALHSATRLSKLAGLSRPDGLDYFEQELS